jgi:hypothetical protein
MRLRTIAVIGILSALAAAAFVVPASGGSADLFGLGEKSIRSGDGAYPYPIKPRPCDGLKGPRRARCARMLAAARRCAKLKERSIRLCSEAIVFRLAADDLEGRDDGTAGSALARRFLIGQLKPFSEGLNGAAAGEDAYLQLIPGGANVMSVIRGTDLRDQYVIVGAHYDHLGSSCAYKEPGDTICNGATDNAAGVAAAVSVGRAIASTRPRRSVVLALWDQEEDGLVGSRYYTEHPLVPLASTVAYVNFDIQGANLLPSLRDTTFAVAAETGGSRLQSIVRSAIDGTPLDTPMLSSIFGQGRSDYASFLNVNVPSVFFTDATGPCYHTAQDETEIVDFDKLERQIGTALAVTRDLANTDTPPSFAPGTPLATYDDAVAISRVVERALIDLGRFSEADQDTIRSIAADLRRIAFEGPAAFGSDDVGTLLGHAATLVLQILPQGECDGFLAPGQDDGEGHDHGHGERRGPGSRR